MGHPPSVVLAHLELRRLGVFCGAPRVTPGRTYTELCRSLVACFELAVAPEGFASMPGMETDNSAANRDADGPPPTPLDAKNVALAGAEEPQEMSRSTMADGATAGSELQDVLAACKVSFEGGLHGKLPGMMQSRLAGLLAPIDKSTSSPTLCARTSAPAAPQQAFSSKSGGRSTGTRGGPLEALKAGEAWVSRFHESRDGDVVPPQS